MSQNLHQIFKNIGEIEPTENLSGRIFACVSTEKDRIIKRKLMVSRLGLGTSAVVFLVASFTFGSAISQSEFWSIMSLVFSDMVMVAQNWQDFTFSLLETFPTVSVVAILVPIMTLLFSFSIYLEASNKQQNHERIYSI
jgi:hypothetical protein